MNKGVTESSSVQNITAAGNPNWWNTSGLRPPPPQLPPCITTTTNLLPTFLPNFFPSPTSSSSSSPSLPITSSPNFSSWLDNSYDLPLDQPWSLSQLLLGGLMMGEEERNEIMHYYHNQNQQHSYQEKKLDNWEEQVLKHQESKNNNGYVIMSSPNSPLNKSCVTTTTIHNNNDHNGLNLSECNSSKIGHESSFANKKPKLQVPSSSQPILKVRKEKLGGRITALHQLVSPFGKTDTASVLSEAIGYIRFLHSQIEALSLPYFGVPSRHNMTHQHAQGGMHCIFPEDPGQLVNDYCMKISKGASFSSSTNNQESNPNEEPKEDLRSRGLCLVPISCTLQVGNDNGADYWTPAF